MSEYMEKHAAARMIGAPPGYAGYGEGMTLTERVRRAPYSLLLFDEIEKAHPDVLSLLLQILEDGRLTDGSGITADFSDCMVILTSNIGAELLQTGAIGFADPENTEPVQQARLLSELRRTMKPELLNRLDAAIVFRKLNQADLTRIARLQLHDLADRAAACGTVLTWTPEAEAFLAAQADTEHGGARAVRTAMTRYAEPLLADRLLRAASGTAVRAYQLTVTAERGLALQEQNVPASVT
ncbi:MAG: ATP-dependent Clp protease ATP-binding subunit [Oscillospiraceae bacterium]|nr:ATP-dependent Clp protease ATP-binding subunit [Oscillospiraceae bacterium]